MNVLYTPYKMFLESHAPGIQKVDQCECSIQMVRCRRGLECKLTRVILTKTVSSPQYKTSVYEESSIKLMKNAFILLSSEKNQVFSPLG